MAIRGGRPPKRHEQALGRFLAQVITSRSGAAFLGWKLESAPVSTDPHAVYLLGRDEVADGVPLSDAELVGWRSLVTQGEGDVHDIEVAHPDTDEDEPRVLGVTRGPFGQATLDAVTEAERYEAETGLDYELRLLKIPALYFIAVWLHGTADGGDHLFPLEDHPAGLSAHQRHAPQEVFDKLRPLAQAAREAGEPETN